MAQTQGGTRGGIEEASRRAPGGPVEHAPSASSSSGPHRPLTAGEAASRDGVPAWDTETSAFLAGLLRREGVDLAHVTECDLVRGTPVYVEADADVHLVQGLMARYHIRSLPVIGKEGFIGLVDLIELALQYDLDVTGPNGA